MIRVTPEQNASAPISIGHYALLSMDRLALLIPQHQVRSLEPALDVQRTQARDAAWISTAGVNWPVYCLSEDLWPNLEVPANRHICALLQSGAGLLGVLCDQVATLERTELDILPLPHCMRTQDTPLLGLVLHAGRVLCVSSANHLLNCVVPRQDTDKHEHLLGRAS